MQLFKECNDLTRASRANGPAFLQFALLEFGNVLFKNEFSLRLYSCLLPDWMLSEESIGGRKCRVVMDTRVSFE